MILIYKSAPMRYDLLRWSSPRTPPEASGTVYVCICNGFTDRQVRTVCDQQQCRVSDIYKALGCAPKCGKCVPMLKELARPAAPTVAFAESVGA